MNYFLKCILDMKI